MKNIEILDKNECCGCKSCSQKCPQKAINMVENNEGFWYPKIDKSKCIDCGLCVKVCPQLKKVEERKDKYPKTYAMYNKNKQELLESSSGGIFVSIANWVLEQNGVVFGAAYDNDLKVKHIKIENQEQLRLLQGSKYVQSDIMNTYKEAEKELKNNKKVLFSGTPCQIYGLKSFLLQEYDNLITCDIVCHGVPSPKLFEKYIEYLSVKYKSNVRGYNFRSKEKKGWGLVTKITMDNGKSKFIEPDFDPYYSNFLDGNTYRECCYNCHYSSYNRVSDVTLADYWGIHKIHPDFYREAGNSLILVNTAKGEDIINLIGKNIKKIETNIDKAADNNKNLKEPSKRTKKRDEIYNKIDEMKSNEYIEKMLKVKVTPKKIIKKLIPNRLKKIIKKARKII
mgnify:CR=1 FL=1